MYIEKNKALLRSLNKKKCYKYNRKRERGKVTDSVA